MEEMENPQTVDEGASPPKMPKKPPKVPTTDVVESTTDGQDARNILEWFGSLSSAGGSFKISISRVEPKYHDGHKVSGLLDTVTDFISEEEIKERFGGGKFQLGVMKMTQQGWKYAGARRIDIVGAPKLEGIAPQMAATVVAAPSEDTGLARQAMASMERMTQMERLRADRAAEEARAAAAEGRSSFADLAMLTKPYEAQLQVLANELRAAREISAAQQTRITELLTRKPDTTGQDKLIEKMYDGESARIEAIRTQHESELRQLRQSHEDDIKRRDERMSNDLERSDRAHERELSNLKMANAQQIDSLKLGYETRLDGLKSEVSRLERECSALKAESTELRSRKEQSITDQLGNLANIKTAMETLGLGGKDDEPPSMVERVLSGVMESPMAQGLAARLAMGAAQQQAQATAPQPVRRVAAPTPQRKLPPHKPMAQIKPRAPAPQVVAPQAPGAPAQPPLTSSPPPSPAVPEEQPDPLAGIQLDKAVVDQAVEFMGHAMQNGADPVEFAATAKSMVPSEIVAALRAVGIDEFLSRVVHLSEDSPFLTQAGRNWTRKVSAALVQ